MLSVSEISVQFGTKKLFDNVSFFVNLKDRIGLVGSNGSGKTTLLKFINGDLEPDTGIIAISKHFTIDYLPQDGITYTGKTLYEEVYSGLTDIDNIKNEINEITKELDIRQDKNSDEYLELVEKLGELHIKFEDLDGFKIKSKIEKILEGLGFKSNEFDNKTDEFSGGWQMRIALAKLLLKNPSLLLLDEPTNHLDIDSLLWLEGYLKSYKGAIILVSHDRQFLNNITNKTIEIYTGKVTLYNGNYNFYLKEKEERRSLLEKRYENQQKYLKQQERFIERFRYKASKASAVQSRIKMLEKLERIDIEDDEQAIHFKFPPATNSGKIILQLKGISKSYGEKEVLKNLDLDIIRGDKIGFVGPNGTGKSTLAKVITGKESFQNGEINFGHNLELEYYSQNQAEALDKDKSVLEIIDSVATGDARKHLRSILGSFLFKDDDVFKPVSVLSGGEKSRLALARMLLKPSNFIIMDEPTNHLDINSKNVLKEALIRYEGSLLIISHDREFLDGLANRVVEIKNKKAITYSGTLTDYLRKKEEEIITETSALSYKNADIKNTYRDKDRKRKEAEYRNSLYKLQKPLKDKIRNVDKEIKNRENKLKGIESNLFDPGFYSKPEDVRNAHNNIKKLKSELEKLMTEWLELNEKLNETERQFINNAQ